MSIVSQEDFLSPIRLKREYLLELFKCNKNKEWKAQEKNYFPSFFLFII